jgi:hypothetical protein
MIAMTAPSGLLHIALGRAGRQTRARTAAHDIDQNQRHFGHAGVAQIFLHQGKARTGGGRHALAASQGRADNGPHAGDFVFHLDIDAVFDQGQAGRHDLGDFGGRGDGIAGVKGTPRQQGSFDHSFVAQCEYFFFLTFFDGHVRFPG